MSDRNTQLKAGDLMVHTDGSIIEIIDEHHYRWILNTDGYDEGKQPIYEHRSQYSWNNWVNGYSLSDESRVDRILTKYGNA